MPTVSIPTLVGMEMVGMENGTDDHCLVTFHHLLMHFIVIDKLNSYSLPFIFGTWQNVFLFQTNLFNDSYFRSKYQNCDKFGFERITANSTHMHVEFVTVSIGTCYGHYW